MEALTTDPRTSGLDGTRGGLKQAKAIAPRLLHALGSNEQAFWVAFSANLVPQIAVLTDRRLLLFSGFTTGAPRVLVCPYLVEFSKDRLMGKEVVLRDANGSSAKLILELDDLARVQKHANPAAASETSSQTAPYVHTEAASQGSAARPPSPGGVAGAPGAWNWGRPVLRPIDAEYLAAAHMEHLGYQGVRVTQVSRDGGLDVVALGASAQVKYHAAPTGSPDVQRLRGAADASSDRLFYATGFTPQGLSAAQQLGVALFQFNPDGLVVAINDPAHRIGARGYTPPSPRGAFGTLTFEGRQNRAVLWAQQIERAAAAPISDRKRKGAKQLQQRHAALSLLTHGLAQLEDSDNPLYKKGRKERTLTQAEKTLKSAAQIVGIRLR